MKRETEIMGDGRSRRDCQGCQTDENDIQIPHSSKCCGTLIMFHKNRYSSINAKLQRNDRVRSDMGKYICTNKT